MTHNLKAKRWATMWLLLGAMHAPGAYASDLEKTAVSAVVSRFHAALRAGDAQTAASLLAADATVMEGGDRETRVQYVQHHLHEDIKFAKAVPGKSSPLDITVMGDVAWASSTSTTRGNYASQAINLSGAELMVLSKSPDGWFIRAIHWSSRKIK